MFRTAALLAASLSLFATAAGAAPCRDAKGKFIKCPSAAAVTTQTTAAKGQKCRDAKGHFAKCGAPGAKPA